MRWGTVILLSFVAVAFPLSSAAPAAQSIRTDGSHLAVPGGRIWYRVVGDGTGTPLILVHGGPGISSVYLTSMEALGDERPVVRYDQLGAGRSDVVTDTSLFTIRRFVEELETLRRHLALDRVHLYGHSWGSIVVMEYYRAHPEHVASLTLASEVLDTQAFFGNMRRLVSQMPDSMIQARRLQEEGQPYDTVAYRAGARWMNRHTTLKPVRAEAETLASTVNDAIATYMNGTSLFKPDGTLRDYDSTPLLRKVTVPVLFTVGEFDFVSPDSVKRLARATPGARFAMIPGAAHMMQWDNAPANNDAVRSFLREVDAGRRRSAPSPSPTGGRRGGGS